MPTFGPSHFGSKTFNPGKSNREALGQIGSELKSNPPKEVQETAQKFGPERAKKQRTAIMFAKARKAGIKVPPKSAP